MKRLCLLLAAACISLVSCSETADDPNDPNAEVGGDEKEYTVKFKVDIHVPELKEAIINNKDDARTMLHAKLYTDLITSGPITPKDYTLKFFKGGMAVGEYKGTWGETEITLPNGIYKVIGQCNGDLAHASFSINDEVVIDKNTSILTLKSQFNCWLFTFDRRAFSNAWWCNGETPGELVYLSKTDDFFYIFNSSDVKLPFVLGSADCNNFHDQIEYTEGNTWHLGLTWQDANKNDPAKVWYCPSVGDMLIGDFVHADKDGHLSRISLNHATE